MNFFKKSKAETSDEKFVRLLREAVGNTQLWVPGIGNGGMKGVLNALSSLNDSEIIRIIRESTCGIDCAGCEDFRPIPGGGGDHFCCRGM
ncbi:MAG: hypothetical protein Athens071425_598 [Parcubacteria group bacterium Athens0714_25]|nr:MAG: hypothetical protein Athens071425_598 [Parcubacteria group bacterium Athens0714_25]